VQNVRILNTIQNLHYTLMYCYCAISRNYFSKTIEGVNKGHNTCYAPNFYAPFAV